MVRVLQWVSGVIDLASFVNGVRSPILPSHVAQIKRILYTFHHSRGDSPAVTNSFSLKSLIPDLAPTFNMTPAALYERQRALVRAGWLTGKEGKGPGSGVQATPRSVSLLLISVLATDSLSEVQAEVGRLASLRIEEELVRSDAGQTRHNSVLECPVSRAQKFDHALESLLRSPTLAGKTSRIIAWRGEAQVRIDFHEEENGISRSSVFGKSSRKSMGLLKIEASIGPGPLVHIANLIPDACLEWWRDYSEEELLEALKPVNI
jgi:hypothetical protein